MSRVRTLSVKHPSAKTLIKDAYPNFHKSGSIRGMKRLFYGKDALLVRCGNFIFNVTSNPNIYYEAH